MTFQITALHPVTHILLTTAYNRVPKIQSLKCDPHLCFICIPPLLLLSTLQWHHEMTGLIY